MKEINNIIWIEDIHRHNQISQARAKCNINLKYGMLNDCLSISSKSNEFPSTINNQSKASSFLNKHTNYSVYHCEHCNSKKLFGGVIKASW